MKLIKCAQTNFNLMWYIHCQEEGCIVLYILGMNQKIYASRAINIDIVKIDTSLVMREWSIQIDD